jgi:hypothetical protein
VEKVALKRGSVGTKGVTSPALPGGFDAPQASRTKGMAKRRKKAIV